MYSRLKLIWFHSKNMCYYLRLFDSRLQWIPWAHKYLTLDNIHRTHLLVVLFYFISIIAKNRGISGNYLFPKSWDGWITIYPITRQVLYFYLTQTPYLSYIDSVSHLENSQVVHENIIKATTFSFLYLWFLALRFAVSNVIMVFTYISCPMLGIQMSPNSSRTSRSCRIKLVL